MVAKPPEVKPLPPAVKRKFLIIVGFSLVFGSLMIFYTVWAGTKRKMYEQSQKQEELESKSKLPPN